MSAAGSEAEPNPVFHPSGEARPVFFTSHNERRILVSFFLQDKKGQQNWPDFYGFIGKEKLVARIRTDRFGGYLSLYRYKVSTDPNTPGGRILTETIYGEAKLVTTKYGEVNLVITPTSPPGKAIWAHVDEAVGDGFLQRCGLDLKKRDAMRRSKAHTQLRTVLDEANAAAQLASRRGGGWPR